MGNGTGLCTSHSIATSQSDMPTIDAALEKECQPGTLTNAAVSSKVIAGLTSFTELPSRWY
jgi:hypothetical protein